MMPHYGSTLGGRASLGLVHRWGNAHRGGLRCVFIVREGLCMTSLGVNLYASIPIDTSSSSVHDMKNILYSNFFRVRNSNPPIGTATSPRPLGQSCRLAAHQPRSPSQFLHFRIRLSSIIK